MVKKSMKKSSTATVRFPDDDTETNAAFSAVRITGKSAAGSAWAILPPMVPRLRTCRSPIVSAASAKPGRCRRADSDDTMSAWTVRAPITRVFPSTFMLRRSGTCPRSIRVRGVASRSFMAGIRLCPPASSLASSPCLFKSSMASSTERTATYLKLFGNIVASYFCLFTFDFFLAELPT